MPDDVSVSAPTEERLPASLEIDKMSTLEVVQLINDQDAQVAGAVAAALPQLAGLVDEAVQRMRAGGRVHYFGAGTSGRLAVIDAAELLPTFNVPPGLVIAHHAGGASALITAAENVEDSVELGRSEASALREQDIAIGLTASGRTPFVGGALAVAREVGALTALITSHPQAELASSADYLLAADTGPEVITGSTRMKAGTAQKLLLNAFSTALMIKLGRTWSNLMVDMLATNAKLRGRVVRILQQATGVSDEVARDALAMSDGELKPALVHLLAGIDVQTARDLLARHDGVVAAALAEAARPRTGRRSSDRAGGPARTMIRPAAPSGTPAR
ncbi:N-acetylmuramic acid 6-phosphate etherase [Nakamurella sp. A5-74]|uniref:N-acetylmuramic acid 6-phosphate etherase n=1 Tax=Nakamurella sp. A5-74 TaxID=3158264 RepID=A0AAU8DSN3_9ACTN